MLSNFFDLNLITKDFFYGQLSSKKLYGLKTLCGLDSLNLLHSLAFSYTLSRLKVFVIIHNIIIIIIFLRYLASSFFSKASQHKDAL